MSKEERHVRYILPKSIRNAIKWHTDKARYVQLSKAERRGKSWEEIKVIKEVNRDERA